MGSIVMEPADITAFKNCSHICVYANRIHATGDINGAHPLEFAVPLLLLQLGLCTGTILLFSRLLKPFGQPLIVSQILGSLVLGYLSISYLKNFGEAIFPLRGFIVLDMVSALGQIFYFFLIGVQTDISIMKNIDKKAFRIGFCSVGLPLFLTSIFSLAFLNVVDIEFVNSLFVIGSAESSINFAMVASLLSELHLINSKFGKIALSSSMASNGISLLFHNLVYLFSIEDEVRYKAASTACGFIVLVATIFAFRPAILWMIKQNPKGEPLKESCVITLLLGVLVVAFLSQASGVHIYFGPLLLGIIIPSGPPIGSALVEKLELITSWVFMPVFFVKLGLIINTYTVKLATILCFSFVIFVSALGKFLGALMISMYYELPTRDGMALGLIFNSQGALELGMFKLMKKDKEIKDEQFVVMCIWVMVLVAVITPIIRYLLDPSKRYVVAKKRTVMHLKPEFDLSVLVCIHDQEDVPSTINLLEALNPTKRSHLIVYMLHLVALLGRDNPRFIHHKLTKVRSSSSCPSEHIVNAFKYFGNSNNEVVIHPFTAISPSATMYDDVCSLALDKKTSLILVPFHKRFHSNGVMSLSKHKIKMLNHHILDKAPCSVALVVERGISKVSESIATNLYGFRIAMVFVGGPDDREALFIGARMAGHPNIHITMIRLLENDDNVSNNDKERRLNNEAVVKYQQIMENNHRVVYKEEMVKDGTGTVDVLRSMGNDFDLVMVGRRHDSCSSLVQGLLLWNEKTELGAIGEVLASSDFLGNATIFVVQQHKKVVNQELESSRKGFSHV